MPIQLAPLSRRRFLRRTLAAGAGFVFAPRLLAADKPSDPDCWAFLSDTHVAADRAQAARGIRMAEHFEIVSRELLALPRRPAGTFITGDCAWQSGETLDYETFVQLLEPVRAGQMPVHIALGNHDHRERFWNALENEKAAKRPLADRQVALLQTPRLNWFLLDSLEKTLSTPGLIGPEQMNWLAAALDANSEKPAAIVLHHNFDSSAKSIGLKDTEDMFKILRPRNQVKACFFGHTHNWNVKPDESGIHLINLPPVAYVFQEGNPSGWVNATVKPDGISLELRCVNPQHARQGEVLNLSWRAA